MIHGELFRGGICAQRDGCDIELTPTLLNFLNTKWMQFAADVVDSFLQFGLAVGGGGASTASVAGFSLFSHGGFPPGRGTYRNAPTYAEAAVALELSESIEKLLLDDFDDEC